MILNLEKAENLPDSHSFMLCFYKKYSNFLYKLAWDYCKNRYEVEDLVQSVWVKLCEKADVLESLPCSCQLSYVSVALRNTAISLSRGNHCHLPLEIADNISYNESDMLAVMMDRKLRIERFKEKWPHVPAAAREILERKYFLMDSDKEIADAMGISPGSVRSYLSRARKSAYAILAEHIEELE